MAMLDPSRAAAKAAAPGPSYSSEELRGYPLGTLVYRAGLLPLQTVDRALGEAENTGRRLGEVLVEHGLPERELSRLLAAQRGRDFVDLTEYPVDFELARTLPRVIADRYCAVPVGHDGAATVVAVADADDEATLAVLRKTLPGQIRVVIAPRHEVEAAIEHAYEGPERRQETLGSVADLVSAVRKQGAPVVRFRRADYDTQSVVECDVYPVGEGAGTPHVEGPFVFGSAHEAKAFVETSLLALQILGCDAA